jgi:hypothetical protein
MFKAKQRVVRILNVMGIETGTIAVIESVRKKVAKLDCDEHLRYDAETGQEINPLYQTARLAW